MKLGEGVLLRFVISLSLYVKLKFTSHDKLALRIGLALIVNSIPWFSIFPTLVNISYAVFCLKKKKKTNSKYIITKLLYFKSIQISSAAFASTILCLSAKVIIILC